MGNLVDVDMKIDPNYLAKSVQDIVKAGIVQALGDPSQIIEDAVDSVIGKKVDKNGYITNDSYRAKPYLEWLAEQVIENTVRECMKEMIEERQEEFKEAIKKQLMSKRFINSMASNFALTMIKGAEKEWKMPINISFEKLEEQPF